VDRPDRLFSWDPVFLAAGVLTGLRVSASMLLGATLCWAVFVPILQHQGVITGVGYGEIVKWTLWGGVACMVTSGLLSFVLQWRSALRAFGNLGKIFSRNGSRATSEMDAIETPTSWFLAGQLIALAALAVLAKATFDMPWWQSTIAVLLTFLLALVACRVTGETDTTPIGPMGKVTQLVFGVLSPGNMNVNLMSANITAGAATSAADLLTDLKSGYLLGANPRKQFLAQLAGIFSGTVVTVLGFRLMVPNASVLGGEKFPAPSAQAWKAVAEVMSHGIASLGPVKIWCLVVGGLVGIILPLLAKMFPKYEKWIPSAAGVGLAWTFHWYFSLLFFLGALVGYVVEKKAPKQSEEFTFPVASGLIAGGAIMGVLLIFCENGPQMLRQLFGR
jgi:OPT family oligopeptide transporter